MNTEALASLLQFADSLFPAGGYAHSFGLETYVQEGTVRGGAEVSAFVDRLPRGRGGPERCRGRGPGPRPGARRR